MGMARASHIHRDYTVEGGPPKPKEWAFGSLDTLPIGGKQIHMPGGVQALRGYKA